MGTPEGSIEGGFLRKTSGFLFWQVTIVWIAVTARASSAYIREDEIGPLGPSVYEQQHDHDHHQQQKHDSQQRCTLYLAESSIPNAGLGIYSGISIRKNETFSHHLDDIVIPIHDIELHNDYKPVKWLISDYTWTASKLGVDVEAKRVKGLAPGLGALANNHQALKNIAFRGVPSNDNEGLHHGGLHRGKHPGAGSITPYYGLKHYATSSIEAGSELFHDYGSTWGERRANVLGPIPLQEHYDKSDKVIACFHKFLTNASLSVHHTLAKDIWNHVRTITNRTDDTSNVITDPRLNSKRIAAPLKNMLSDRSCRVQDVRTETALNFSYTYLQTAMNDGSARASLPNFIRSLSWLEKNGRCMDGLSMGPSSVREAGRGAFATRNYVTGNVITTTPLLPINRSLLETYQFSMNHPGKRKSATKLGRQLLFNYCFGHRASSLVFFPYAPAVTMINHGGGRVTNARIDFSNISWNQRGWQSDSAEELLNKGKSGLVLDIIATKPIQSGDEVFLDYGREWDRVWQRHVDSWTPAGDAVQSNQKTKTMPYTSDIHLPGAFRSSIGIPDEIFPDSWRDLL